MSELTPEVLAACREIAQDLAGRPVSEWELTYLAIVAVNARDFIPLLLAEIDRLQAETPHVAEEWIEYGLQWDGKSPNGEPLFLLENNPLPGMRRAYANAELKSEHYEQASFPNTVMQRTVTAGEWEPIPEGEQS